MSNPEELDVTAVAKLARLKLSAEETQLFQEQLAQVMKHFAKLREIDLENVEPAAHARPIFDVERADEIGPGLTSEQALSNAPRAANDLFLVTKVVE